MLLTKYLSRHSQQFVIQFASKFKYLSHILRDAAIIEFLNFFQLIVSVFFYFLVTCKRIFFGPSFVLFSAVEMCNEGSVDFLKFRKYSLTLIYYCWKYYFSFNSKCIHRPLFAHWALSIAFCDAPLLNAVQMELM